MKIISIFSINFKSLDLELEVKKERLKIWSDATGLSAELLNTPKAAWFAANHLTEEYENMQLLLTKIEAEVNVIAAEVQRTTSSRPAFRLYYRLQKLQDQLWDGQPYIVRCHMFDRLEEMMLSKRDHAQS